MEQNTNACCKIWDPVHVVLIKIFTARVVQVFQQLELPGASCGATKEVCVTSLHLKGSCGACGMSMLKIAHVEDGVASAGHELLVGGGWCD
eukprot:s4094_g9.t1